MRSTMLIKTSELVGVALDYAVAKCENVDVVIHMGRVYIASSDFVYSPATSWDQGGAIIDRENIFTYPKDLLGHGFGASKWKYPISHKYGNEMLVNYTDGFAATPLIAAMRCYVYSMFGPEIEIPNDYLVKTSGVSVATKLPNVGNKYYTLPLLKSVVFTGNDDDFTYYSSGNMYLKLEDAHSELETQEVATSLRGLAGCRCFIDGVPNYCLKAEGRTLSVEELTTEYHHAWRGIAFDTKAYAESAIDIVGSERIISAMRWDSFRENFNEQHDTSRT